MTVPVHAGMLDCPQAHSTRLRDVSVTRGRWRARLWHWLRTAWLRRQNSGPMGLGEGVGEAADPAGTGEAAMPVGDMPDGAPRFPAFFAQYHLSLLDYLYGMTRDRELAADLVQDTFAKAFADAPELAGIVHPKAWLYTIATHLALNAARHRGRFEWLPLSRVEPEVADEAAGGAAEKAWATLPPVVLPQQGEDDLAASVAERDAVWGVLAELPPRWRAVLLLQAHVGYEVREIVAMLHPSEANVRKILFQAKQRFRTRYAELATRGA